MLLAVPSWRRAENGQAQTLEHWPASIPLHVFVRAEEMDKYGRLLRGMNRIDMLVGIPTGIVCNISTTRNWILQWAADHGHEKVVMIDDDLHFICRGQVPDDDVHLRPCRLEDYEALEAWFDHKLEYYAHAGVSMREGNNRLPGLYAEAEATRAIRMVGYDLRRLEDVSFRPEVDGREDLDMTLQLLRRGLANVVTYHWAQGQKVANAPGGLSEYRDVAHSDASALKLAALHPGLVKLREKHNTSAGEFGVRTETTIYWKRALDEGLRRG